MSSTAPIDRPFSFIGGSVALDFAATVGHRRSDRIERLATPADLSRWTAASGLVDTPAAATAADLPRARALREAVYRCAHAAPAGRPYAYDPADRTLINNEAAGPVVRLELTPDGTARRTGTVEAVLATVARAAIELLSSPAAAHVKECAAPECTGLYVDRSRHGSRRWCDMRACGNRAKAAEFRRRRQGSAS